MKLSLIVIYFTIFIKAFEKEVRMNSRPVLAMSFYKDEAGKLINPYEKMILEAKREKH